MNEYDKWNKYTIGNIHFVNNLKQHPCKQLFIDWVLNHKDIKSIIEIGPGECVECQLLLSQKPGIKYTIMDVSQTFLDNCKVHLPKVKQICSPIESYDAKNFRKKDLVYCAYVLEHTKNVIKTIDTLFRLSDKYYYFTLFKWGFDGSLKPTFSSKRNYWSSTYNINMLLSCIKEKSESMETILIKKTGEISDFSVYAKGRIGEHRNGDHLVIRGTVSK